MNPIIKASNYLGSQAELARKLAVTPQAVSNWARGVPVPVDQVLRITSLSDGHVTPYELRSDIYPDPNWLPPGIKRIRRKSQ